MSNESKWIRRGMVTIGALAAAVLMLTMWTLVVALESQQAQAERATATIEELDSIADRLDTQADALEDEAISSAESRRRFEAAVRILFEELEIDDDPFVPPDPPPPDDTHDHDSDEPPEDPDDPEPEPSPSPSRSPSPDPEPEPSPSPERGPLDDVLDLLDPDGLHTSTAIPPVPSRQARPEECPDAV